MEVIKFLRSTPSKCCKSFVSNYFCSATIGISQTQDTTNLYSTLVKTSCNMFQCVLQKKDKRLC